MFKSLISRNYRGGADGCLGRYSRLVGHADFFGRQYKSKRLLVRTLPYIFLSLLAFWTVPAFAAISCQKPNWTGFVPCNSPEAAICNGTQSTFVPECAALGFGVYVGEGEHCVDPSCTTPIGVAVPELEEYAAAMFLGLALFVGWQVRRRHHLVS